jgi:hypothetical protein
MGDNEIKMAQMQKDIDYIKKDMGELKDLVVELPQRLDNAVAMLTKEFDRREERYNEKYAPMPAWTVLVWAARTAGVSVIGIIIYLIFKYGHIAL